MYTSGARIGVYADILITILVKQDIMIPHTFILAMGQQQPFVTSYIVLRRFC
jgi:hypothetical protein